MTEKTAAFYWFVVWLAIGFGVPETWALVTHRPQFTLSETAWRLLDVLPGSTHAQWTFLHLLVSFLLFWLFLHISFGLFR